MGKSKMGKSKQSTVKLLNKFSFAQNSNVKLAVLTSVLSLTLFFTIAFFSPFKDTLLSTIFPKPSSYAITPFSSDLIKNGSFEGSLSSWILILSSPASVDLIDTKDTAADGKFSANINIKSTSLKSWYAQFRQNDLSIVAGKTYTLTFWALAGQNISMDYVLQLVNYPYKRLFSNTVSLSTKWKKYSYTYRATTSYNNVFVGFNLTNTKSNVWIDNISLISR